LLNELDLSPTIPTTPTQSGNYTLYFYNLADPQGWRRSGSGTDVFTTEKSIRQSINQRIAQDRRNGSNIWTYGFIQTETRPSSGEDERSDLPPGVTVSIVYVPPGYSRPPTR